MLTYTLTDAKTRHGEVFERAVGEPVLLTKNGRQSHVVMSARFFDYLMDKLRQAEDGAFGEWADHVKATMATVGSERFEQELKRIANDKA